MLSPLALALTQTVGATIIVRGLVLAGSEITKSKNVDGVGIAIIESVEAAGKEARIVDEVIIEMIPDELAKLLSQLSGRRCHGRKTRMRVRRVYVTTRPTAPDPSSVTCGIGHIEYASACRWIGKRRR